MADHYQMTNSRDVELATHRTFVSVAVDKDILSAGNCSPRRTRGMEAIQFRSKNTWDMSYVFVWSVNSLLRGSPMLAGFSWTLVKGSLRGTVRAIFHSFMSITCEALLILINILVLQFGLATKEVSSYCVFIDKLPEWKMQL